ncbi:hypothetical protein ACHAQA_004157 [Verticillium albo-atrum]
MESVLADRERVYLVCRAIFSGEYSKLKSAKKMRKLLRKNKASIEPLSQEFGLDKLHEIVLCLCTAGLFESEGKARIEFPRLYQAVPQPCEPNDEPEADAMSSDGVLLDDLGVYQGEDEVAENEGVQLEPATSSLDLVQMAAVPHALRSNSSSSPSYFPYETQHLILTTTQRVLEECCFDFASKWFPSVPKTRGWDCAAAVELTTWVAIFKRKLPKLPCDALKVNEQSLERIFDPIRVVRHTAVHRLRTTAQDVSRLVGAALNLTEALRDYARSAKLALLKTEVDGKVTALEVNRTALEVNSKAQLDEITRQRAALDKQERDIILQKGNEDRDYQGVIGSILVTSVKQIFMEK